MRRVRSGIVVLVVCLFISSAAHGGDDNRKGYFSGFGLGGAPVSGWRVDADRKHFTPAVALNVFIGYAWNSRNAIALENNRSFKLVDSIDPTDDRKHFSEMGLWGFSWYHYYSGEGNSLYTAVGIGQYFAHVQNQDLSGHLGYLLGCGYEFRKHWQVGLYATGTKARSSGYEQVMTTYYQMSLEIINVLY